MVEEQLLVCLQLVRYLVLVFPLLTKITNAAIFTNNTEFLTVDGRVGVGTVTLTQMLIRNEKKINVGFITAKSIAGDIDGRNMVVVGVGTFGSTGSFGGDITVNSVTVGKGANSVATNTVLGVTL